MPASFIVAWSNKDFYIQKCVLCVPLFSFREINYRQQYKETEKKKIEGYVFV